MAMSLLLEYTFEWGLIIIEIISNRKLVLFVDKLTVDGVLWYKNECTIDIMIYQY